MSSEGFQGDAASCPDAPAAAPVCSPGPSAVMPPQVAAASGPRGASAGTPVDPAALPGEVRCATEGLGEQWRA